MILLLLRQEYNNSHRYAWLKKLIEKHRRFMSDGQELSSE